MLRWEEGFINGDILVAMPFRECTEQLCAMLVNHGLSVTLVCDVDGALEKLKSHISTFLLLDFKLDGAIAFLERVISTFYDPPPYIIAADAFSCSMAQANALNMGADACVGKPLDIEEVLAVIDATLRRTDRLARPKPLLPTLPINQGTMHIDQLRHRVIMDGKEVLLTVKEYDVLCFLASYPDTVFSKAQIYERVWCEDYEFASTSVSDMISSLRKKLGLNPRDGRYIQTVRGVGYRFVKPE